MLIKNCAFRPPLSLVLGTLTWFVPVIATAGDNTAVKAPQQTAISPGETDENSREEDNSTKNEIFAEIQLTGSYPEGAQLPGLFGAMTENLDDALSRLEEAANDDRIAGILLKLDPPGSLQLNFSTAYAFDRAINKVQDAGKPVYAWLTTTNTPGYLVAATCDRVYMPRSGALMVLGLRAEVTFYKNLLDELDINAEMLKIGKFKSAAEPFTRTEMSPAFRKEMEELLDDLYGVMVKSIATGRDLTRDQVTETINHGPLTASSARKSGFIDGFAYEDEIDEVIANQRHIANAQIANDYAKEEAETDFSGLAGFIKLMELMTGTGTSASRTTGPTIAVVYATGAIMSGKSQSGLFSGSILGSETLIDALETAADDDDVKAIVLRVNSPGGSALASDLIWRSVELAQQEKPVLVSMGRVAASGGYYISMGSDLIVAEPTTITGSIGVVGGKLAFGDFLDKFGITTSVISRGENSGTLSLLSGFSESERAAMKKMLDDIYSQFTSKAAKGRDMPLDELKELAGGRVYSGMRAEELGLVDKIGSLQETIKLAKTEAVKRGLLDEGQDVEIEALPEAKSPFEQLFGPIGGSSLQSRHMLATVTEAIPPRLAELLSGTQIIRLLAAERILTIMPFHIRVR